MVVARPGRLAGLETGFTPETYHFRRIFAPFLLRTLILHSAFCTLHLRVNRPYSKGHANKARFPPTCPLSYFQPRMAIQTREQAGALLESRSSLTHDLA